MGRTYRRSEWIEVAGDGLELLTENQGSIEKRILRSVQALCSPVRGE
jgi:hypothetical protein